MTGPELMRSSTILAAFGEAGAKVISITAKDKLRQQLGKDMDIGGRRDQLLIREGRQVHAPRERH